MGSRVGLVTMWKSAIRNDELTIVMGLFFLIVTETVAIAMFIAVTVAVIIARSVAMPVTMAIAMAVAVTVALLVGESDGLSVTEVLLMLRFGMTKPMTVMGRDGVALLMHWLGVTKAMIRNAMDEIVAVVKWRETMTKSMTLSRSEEVLLSVGCSKRANCNHERSHTF